MKLELNGKVVIVTGGGGAIGSAVCKRFAENGAKVVAAGRTLEKLEKLANEIKAAGGEAIAVQVDVADKASAKSMVEAAVAAYGRVDILVNSAGVKRDAASYKPLHEFDDDLWMEVIRTEVTGVFNCCKQAIQQMVKQGEGGAIVNVGSATGVVAAKNQCAFAAAKAGVFNFTKAMAMEVAPENIRVNAVAPSQIFAAEDREALDPKCAAELVSHIPAKRTGAPADVADMICFLADDSVAAYITGAVVTVDGGWTSGFSRDF